MLSLGPASKKKAWAYFFGKNKVSWDDNMLWTAMFLAEPRRTDTAQELPC